MIDHARRLSQDVFRYAARLADERYARYSLGIWRAKRRIFDTLVRMGVKSGPITCTENWMRGHHVQIGDGGACPLCQARRQI